MLMDKWHLPENAKFQLVLTCKLFAFYRCADACHMPFGENRNAKKQLLHIYVEKEMTQLLCQVQKLEAIDAV